MRAAEDAAPELESVSVPESSAPSEPARRRGRRAKAAHHGVHGLRDDRSARLQYALVRAIVFALLALPDVLRQALLRGLAWLAWLVDRRHTRGAQDFLETALGAELSRAERARLVRASYLQLANVTLDAILRPRRVPPERLADHYEDDLSEDARALFERGGPAILLSGHIGDWEAGGPYMRARGFDPLWAVAKPPKNKRLSIWMEGLRRQCGLRVISRYGAMREAFAAVAAGGSLVLIVDHRATMRPVIAPFFGRAAACERSTAVLLKRARVPAMVAACYRAGRRFHYLLAARRVFQPEELAAMTPEEIVAAVNRELEELIRARPEQYFWLHDRYRGRPRDRVR